ncbi:PREDICTED: C-type lectin 1-like [Thamnophis sirtalis]|uniref:C-type lectin 1-like n=1 Tax=Thamnophis sirtalis TaxID=35019 RepID=A0A6I9YF25_9SAUR|nr:PREDICTED: C-type lectin 1-like [Thamnophis sirtalis]
MTTCHHEFDTSERTCQEAKENGHLASIKDVEGAAKLSKYLRENSILHFDVWIGMRLSKINNKWEWSDGSNVTYVSWEKGQPDNFLKLEFCAVVTGNSRKIVEDDGFECDNEELIKAVTPEEE